MKISLLAFVLVLLQTELSGQIPENQDSVIAIYNRAMSGVGESSKYQYTLKFRFEDDGRTKKKFLVTREIRYLA
ncbi:hypothetical protein [Flavihumibacter petaseus]|uniref:hypothetical protein n=1 Tax=Flavihumibacter petaseus TaxID=549295 RepID=UPI00061CED33|nr:hypothetical protein [Flavihumibacter petaseus]